MLTVTGLPFPWLTHGNKGRQREGHFPAGTEHKLHERKEGEEALEKHACALGKINLPYWENGAESAKTHDFPSRRKAVG